MSAPQLYVITPAVADAAGFAPQLEAACAGSAIAAVLLRLEPSDERTLVNRVKALAPAAQAKGAAVLIAAEGGEVDLAAIAARGGADGVHAGEGAALRDLRGRLKGERILGAGNLRSRHEAMEAGEAGVDYVLFGEPRPDGTIPPLEAVIERAAWWAEIFETPCVAYASGLETLPGLAATGAEFVALGDAIWKHPDGPAAALGAVRAALASAGKTP